MKKNSLKFLTILIWKRYVDSDSDPKLSDETDPQKSKIILKVAKLGRKSAAQQASAAELKKQEIMETEENSETSTNPDDDMNQYEDLFASVMYATDHENRLYFF